MIKWLAKWILQDYICETQSKWWKAGVNQQLHEPESAKHGHISASKYWHGIEGEE